MYRVKMTNKEGTKGIEEISMSEQVNRKKQTKSVSVKLSKNVLDKMRKVAGIKVGSDEQILHAYLVKTLENAEV